MGGIEFDLTEYEDPAPKDLIRGAESGTAASRIDASVTKKPKLPFRANVQVEGKKYKGRRTSRADLELDPATIGLVDSDEADYEPLDHSLNADLDFALGEGDDELSNVEDVQLRDSDHESLKESGLEEDESKEDPQQSARERLEELQVDERAIAERLVRAEEEDLRRARAVQKQREKYDSVVNLRIKLEPLMSLARAFPSVNQRKESSSWNESDELQKAMSSAESALASLCAQAEKVYNLSWPSGGNMEAEEKSRKESTREFVEWRNGILDEWGRKVNEAEGIVPKGGFKAIDTSISSQMKASLESGKHLERTRRVRETMDLVGGLELEQGSHDMQYDDGELYRTLLRDIIESGDATGGGLRYAQLSKGGRIKKKRDRSFAKSKRLNYEVHEKLAGFLAPVPLPDPGPVDEIIASLFGGAGTVTKDQ